MQDKYMQSKLLVYMLLEMNPGKLHNFPLEYEYV